MGSRTAGGLQGRRVCVVEGSGLNSGRCGVVVGSQDIPAALWTHYPHNGGIRPGWVPIVWDDGEPDTFPSDRLRILDDHQNRHSSSA